MEASFNKTVLEDNCNLTLIYHYNNLACMMAERFNNTHSSKLQ